MTEDRKLFMFANDVEWIVAYDPEDAVSIWEKATGAKYADDWYSGEFEQLDDDVELTITDGIEQAPPEGAVLVSKSQWETTYRATMHAWINARGRGYLASSEY